MNISTYESQIRNLQDGGGGSGGIGYDLVIQCNPDYSNARLVRGDYQSLLSKMGANEIITGVMGFIGDGVYSLHKIYYLNTYYLNDEEVVPVINISFMIGNESTGWNIKPDNTIETTD